VPVCLNDAYHFAEVLWAGPGGSGGSAAGDASTPGNAAGAAAVALDAGLCLTCASVGWEAEGRPLVLLDASRDIAIAIVGDRAFLSAGGVHGEYGAFHAGEWLAVDV
jgi:hypothetical protein